MSDPDAISDAVGEAIAQVIAGETEMITRWIAIIEVLDGKGKRACYTLTQQGAKPWDTLGLLTFAIQAEQVAALRDDEP